MGKLSKKAIVLVCCAALLLSLTGCNGTEPSIAATGRHSGGDSKPEGSRETSSTYATDPSSGPTATYVNDGDYIPTSDTLTYPDHVATYEEIHPAHQRGNISGKEAVSLLSAVENSLIHHEINSYAMVEIYFEKPEDFGFDIKEPTWGEDISDGGYDEEKAFYQSQLDLLLTIDGESLTGDDKLCYERMVYNCEEKIYIYSYTAFNYYSMVFNYLVGPQSEILFVLDVYSFDTVKDAENYILLVKDIDRYFDSMCEFEETRAELGFASSDNSYEKAAESFDNLVAQKDDCFLYDSFEERLDNIRGLSSSEKNRLISENEKAMKDVMFPEFEECAERMRALKGSGGTDCGISAYRGGDAYFAALTRTSTNSNATVNESIDVLDRTIQDVYDEFMNIASSGFDWYSEYMHHTYSKGDIVDNLDYLDDAIKGDFPGIPAHEYSLMDVPEVFEENFSPAAYLGYHIDNYNANLLIVNNGQVDENYGISIAHEGYPGHMFQSVYTRSHTKHIYLYLFESIGYSEGWATYVEYYSMKYFSDSGKPTKAMILKRDEWILGILASTRAEYGIHVENWSMQDCLDYFDQMGFGVNEDDFSEFYTLIVTDPGYYAKYGMGYLWTQKIMDDMRAKYPDATEKQIHTAYLDSLTMTFDKISENMDAELG
ncbi:MAG: DUF885 family protein [Clostridiales bacterium]|nr:DUF885 family protein [Clostridiales bacterium]